MDLFYVLLILAVLLGFVGLLIYMQKKHISFSKRVFTGLGVGILFGLALQFLFEPDSYVIETSADWMSIIGSGYVRFLQMIVTPTAIG